MKDQEQGQGSGGEKPPQTTAAKSKRTQFKPPSPAEVETYASEKGLAVDAVRFCDFYGSKGWLVGKSKMHDWRAAVRNWARRDVVVVGGGGDVAKDESWGW